MTILTLFKNLYEYEYKWNKINNSEFLGHPDRKNNILNDMEKRSKNVIQQLASTLAVVYQFWLDIIDINSQLIGHANLSSPNKTKNEQIAFEVLSVFSMLDIKLDVKAKFDISHLANIDKIHEYTTNLFDQYFSDKTFLQAINTLYDKNIDINDKDNYLNTFGNEIYPLWLSGMEQQTVSNVVTNNIHILQGLHNIDTKDIKTQFKEINIAINGIHINGPMMDYYKHEFGVGKEDLDELSNLNTDEWDKELKLIGVKF